MKGIEMLTGLFAMLISKLTLTEEKVSSIPSHRWEVYPGNYREFQKNVVSDYDYCRKLQKKEKSSQS